MKTIKIRFVKIDGNFYAQRKYLFGWSYITVSYFIGDEMTCCKLSKTSKEKLLQLLVEKYFSKYKKGIEIIEYPTLITKKFTVKLNENQKE